MLEFSFNQASLKRGISAVKIGLSDSEGHKLPGPK